MSYAISSSDPQAVEKLTEKLEICEEFQKLMKSVNAYWRKNGTCAGCPGIADSEAAKLDVKAEKAYSFDKQPFASYALTNNNAEIRRLKTRIEEVTKKQNVGYAGWQFDGGVVEVNNNIDRLQLYFDEKPNENQRSVLKHNGFKWAPSEGAWQRQLNGNAIYAAERIDFIKPLNGKRPSELQAKVSEKSSVIAEIADCKAKIKPPEKRDNTHKKEQTEL